MTPRERTAAHLQRLAQVATVSLLAATASQGQDPGYAVVDPMPPPAEPCEKTSDADLLSQLWVYASPIADGAYQVNLNASRFTDLSVAKDQKIDGASLVSRTDLGWGVQLVLKPAAATGPVVLHLGLSCQGKPKKLKATFPVGLSQANAALALE